MRKGIAGAWVMCFVGWACVFAVPGFAQAPDQGPAPPARPQLLLMGGDAPPGAFMVVGPGQPRPGTRPWGPEQATGAPDTDRAGDIPTAWASLEPNAGAEWLQVDYDQAVTISEVRIRESFNPGAVSKVVAILQDGKEHTLWEGFDPTIDAPPREPGRHPPVLREGFDPTIDAPADFVVKAEGDVVSKSIKIYLDTTRKDGWNEIDAVELVGKDGKRQWASHATASSTYATLTERRMGEVQIAPEPMVPGPLVFGPRILDAFANIGQRRVTVYLEGGRAVSGTFARAAGGFIVIEQPEAHKTMIVNVQKIVYLETAE